MPKVLGLMTKPVSMLPELTVVKLLERCPSEEGTLPSGASGTIVANYPETRTCTVEFFEPIHCVATVPVEAVRQAVDHLGAGSKWAAPA